MNIRALRFALAAFAVVLGTVCTAAAFAGEKIFVVILENEDGPKAIQQPFLSRLAASGAQLTNYNGVAHPSEPNYIALVSGSTWDIRDDNRHTLDATHLGDLLEAKGLSWKTYAEGYPGNCDLRSGAGKYARKHVPFLSFANIQNDPARCARVVAGTAFDEDLAAGTLPDFALYIPDDRNNGHDTGVKYADNWLEGRFGALLKDKRFIADRLFVVIFDEGRRGNTVYAALFGDMVKPGAVSDAPYTHYSLLRTIEDRLGLGTLGRDDNQARPINGVFK